MAKKVLMPQLGESVTEGTLTRWLKAPGEDVKEYEPLVEINTDKVDTEVPSPSSGVLLQILVPEGTTVQVGQLLAWIGEPGETLDGPSGRHGDPTQVLATQSPTSPSKSDMPISAAGHDRELGFISPVVARMASEHSIDLYSINGSGQGGRITKKDLELFLEGARKGLPHSPN